MSIADAPRLPVVELGLLERANSQQLDLDAIRERLRASGGQEYWRSLEELAETPEFRDFLEREFPRQASVWDDSFDRRKFLTVMGASMALAGATGCLHQPEEKIVPYVRQPANITQGVALQYATAMSFNGFAEGLLVTSRMGRPIKIEGNPDHPASQGSTHTFAQASILDMYDPDRSKSVINRGNPDTWARFVETLEGLLPALRDSHGAGLTILTETVTSPSLTSQLEGILKALPEAKWRQYQPIHRANVRAGSEAAFGENLTPIYRFDQADVVVALDCDFLTSLPGSVRYARDFVDGRRVVEDSKKMNRLYAIESTPTLAGVNADHRFPVAPSKVEAVARAIAAQLDVTVAKVDAPADVIPADALATIVGDLKAHHGKSVVVPGDGQPPAVHALAHAINAALGAVGQTVFYVEPVATGPADQTESLVELTRDLRDGKVQTLLILGGNPVYSSPAEIDFAGALAKALALETVDGKLKASAVEPSLKLCVRLGEYYDETSLLAHWHIPAAHYLESWGDLRAYDGTASVIQPLIAPLYGGKTPQQVLAVLEGRTGLSASQLIEAFWQTKLSAADFTRAWRKIIHDGVAPDTKLAAKEPTLKFEDKPTVVAAASGDSFEVTFDPDPSTWDGRYANNAWLQELAKPLTKLVWDNAALVSPRTWEKYKLRKDSVIELKTADGRKIEAPVYLMPGQPDDCIGLTLGYGRERAGVVGSNIGYNAYKILPSSGVGFITGVSLSATKKHYRLVTTHNHWSMESRNLVHAKIFDHLNMPEGHAAGKSSEADAKEHETKQESDEELVDKMRGFKETGEPVIGLFPDYKYNKETIDNRWAMSIDTTACIGCNACVIACQAENNIPVVGKDRCAEGREMHWLRIDRYYKGPLDNPQAFFQPVPCMHCEDAPCELVCPVAATTHDAEGLNNMVYNRCVGTRYCSNNCPYKVRRFNFFNYTKITEPTLKMLQNPEVTIRSRGVMEKCSYCLQRIDATRITAKKENRPIRDGEVQTACQAVCPTRAITFGNLNDSSSQVVKMRESPLDFALLEELGTRPRTRYLARVHNPHPNLAHPDDNYDTEVPGVRPVGGSGVDGEPEAHDGSAHGGKSGH
jgi:molybdopterin-containing oxidoreductase family iron-sulfur binding subunit